MDIVFIGFAFLIADLRSIIKDWHEDPGVAACCTLPPMWKALRITPCHHLRKRPLAVMAVVRLRGV